MWAVSLEEVREQVVVEVLWLPIAPGWRLAVSRGQQLTGEPGGGLGVENSWLVKDFLARVRLLRAWAWSPCVIDGWRDEFNGGCGVTGGSIIFAEEFICRGQHAVTVRLELYVYFSITGLELSASVYKACGGI